MKCVRNTLKYQTAIDYSILKMPITRSKSISEQVNELLRGRILDSTYVPGGRLPSESELSQEFGVSRATIRTVLAKLASEGLILRKQGDGTYVNERIDEVNAHVGGLWDFVRLIESSGYQASIESLSIEKRAATEQETFTLAIQPGDEVLALKRLFFANSNPVILATNVLPSNLIVKDTETFDGRLHIRDFLQQYCRRRIMYAISDVRASLAKGEVAGILHREPGSPLLDIRIAFYDRDNAPIVCGQSYYNDEVLRLRLVQTWG